jgi:EmrB/QacA subfamily drug resistance transporter
MTATKAQPLPELQEQSLSKATILGMFAMGVAVLVVANDFTALSVALPAMEKSLHTDITTVQWVINGYAMVFGVLIVTGGRLADMFGRRRIFILGAAIFALFSLIGGIAPDVWVLLTCRFLMGIGGALMWPAILGMTYGLLPPNKAGLAGGVILGAAGFGNAVGPLLGGVLTDSVGWRWIFYLNLPVAAAATIITLLVVPADAPKKNHGKIDYRGTAELSLGLLALLLALDWALDLGWTAPRIVFLFAFAAVAFTAFLFTERRAGDSALVPRSVVQNRRFLAAGIATFLASAIFFAALLYLPQFMSKWFGFSAMRSGAGLLPMMGTFMLTSFVAGKIYERFGPKTIVTAGAVFLGTGMMLLSAVSGETTYAQLVPGMVVLGIGVGLFYSSVTTAAITALDPSESSLAGAIVYMFQIAGGSIGVGFNTAIVVSAASLPLGIHTAFFVDGLLAMCSAAVALLFVGGEVDLERLRMLRHHHRAHA